MNGEITGRGTAISKLKETPLGVPRVRALCKARFSCKEPTMVLILTEPGVTVILEISVLFAASIENLKARSQLAGGV